ncbi:flagellar biosynthetic protein FliO [Rhodoferax sp. OV413]|uniref:FliO/MopB family protein n=1 Tax=Rhodoferax sp. OV413 TaxID=1855285 RepID=UPI0025FD8BC4|nr:flagellar biosynthetic protein FliO [Rhodoferax sp. OV413]
MSTQLIPVIGFLIVLACLPFFLKWLKARVPNGLRLEGTQNRFVSAVSVGPHQRVVTVEVGPANARVWLVLGVSSAGIQCLHTAVAPASAIGMTEAAEATGTRD